MSLKQRTTTCNSPVKEITYPCSCCCCCGFGPYIWVDGHPSLCPTTIFQPPLNPIPVQCSLELFNYYGFHAVTNIRIWFVFRWWTLSCPCPPNQRELGRWFWSGDAPLLGYYQELSRGCSTQPATTQVRPERERIGLVIGTTVTEAAVQEGNNIRVQTSSLWGRKFTVDVQRLLLLLLRLFLFCSAKEETVVNIIILFREWATSRGARTEEQDPLGLCRIRSGCSSY